MRLVALTIAAALASPALAQTAPPSSVEAHLIDLEKQSWAAWQKMDAAFWERFLSDDHVELNPFVGAVGKKAVIKGIADKECKVTSYKVDRFTFRQIDPNTAMLIYHAEQDTTCGAVKVPSPVWATSLYQLRKGRWENVLYGHIPAIEPPKAKPKPS